MVKMILSRRGLVIVLSSMVVFAGCVSSMDDEERKLRARSLYEQGLRSLTDRQISMLPSPR